MNGTARTARKKDMMAAPSSARPGATLTGAQALVWSLEEVGATVVFGIPGGAILPAYDPLYDSTRVRHILVRHEQGAGHAAEGYAQATGKVGVCMATSGPGATNLVTPIADAYMDSVPIVAITGQVGRAFIGTDAMQTPTLPVACAYPWCSRRPRCRRPSRPRSTSPRRDVPGRCWWTCRRTCSRSERRSPGRPGSTCPATAR